MIYVIKFPLLAVLVVAALWAAPLAGKAPSQVAVDVTAASVAEAAEIVALGAPACVHVSAERACDDLPVCLNDLGHVRVPITIAGAPSGSVVTSVHYSITVRSQSTCIFDDECGCDLDDFDDLFVQDLRLQINNSQSDVGGGATIWDHDGQASDRGDDDDAADDRDIELHRTIPTFFDGDRVNQTWYVDLWDEAVADEGQLECFEIYICYEGPQLSTTIIDAWWTDEIDEDDDECFEGTALLHWDPNVVGGDETLQVFERIFFNVCGNATFFEYSETQPHFITGTQVDDLAVSIPMTGECDCYNYRIDIFRVGVNVRDYSRNALNDMDLSTHLEELRPDPCIPADCSDGNPCTTDRCINGTCAHIPVAEGTVCGSSPTLACDVQNTCDMAGRCVERVRNAGEVCRSAVHSCDKVEICNGQSPSCPVDEQNPDGTLCGSAIDNDCNNPDTCAEGQCVTNYERFGTACTSDGHSCTDDICDGQGFCMHVVVPNCPADCRIVLADPPICAIDARQPHPIDTLHPRPQWDHVILTLEGQCTAEVLDRGDFQVFVIPEVLDPPTVDVVKMEGTIAHVGLSSPMPSGSWTCIVVQGVARGCWGALPSDVNQDRVGGALDILRLIDCLNGVVSCALHQTDLNNTGQATAADILRVVDLLNGAGLYDPWLDHRLPICPALED